MSKFLLVFSLLFGGSLSSQVDFYIRPSIQMKTNQSKINFDNAPNIYSNEYFSFYNKPMFFSSGEINWGVHLGAVLKKKHFIEFGINGDHVASSSGLSAYSPAINSENVNEYYASATKSTIGSTTMMRFNLNYSKLLYQSSKGIFDLRLSTGLGLWFNRYTKPKEGIYYESEISSFPLDEIRPNVYNTEVSTRIFAAQRFSMCIQLGLGFDFNTLHKKKYLFSFDVFYLQNHRVMATYFTKATIIDHNNEYVFHQKLVSKGSGVYFQLSRRFQVHPWRPNRKEKSVGL